MNNSLIRWGKDDRQNLRKAVNNFNSKIRRLEREGRENLPSTISYKELVGWGSDDKQILSRKELNQTIRSLRNFSKRGAEKEVILPSGQTITKWQDHEIKIQQNRAERRLRGEILELDLKSMFGMGNKEIQQKEKQLESIKNLQNKKGYDFKRGLEALKNISSASKELKDAKNWQENFLYALDELDGFDNVDLLKSELKKIKNPIQLYDYVQKSEILKDLFLYYKEKATAQTYGGFKDNQEAFDSALRELGILQQ